MTPSATAVVLTVGNEIVSGDVENTNASWLARRLAELGLEVKLLAAVRDSVEEVAEFLRAEMDRVGVVIVTGGLGGTPDDLTREAVAEAFGVPTEEIPSWRPPCASASGRAASATTPPAGRRSRRGAVPLENPLGGAPGSSSATCTCSRVSRVRWRRCSRRSRTASGASRSARGAAATRPVKARSSRCSRRRPSAIRRHGRELPVVPGDGPGGRGGAQVGGRRGARQAAAWLETALEERMGR